MATRSRIGIENVDGTISSIYCHWDGYPKNNAVLLERHYQNREKVEKLINLGSISYLAPLVEPTTETHSFNSPEDDVVVAYHRDRGEEYIGPRVDNSKEDYLSSDLEEYGYLYTLEGEWLVILSKEKIEKCGDYLR